MQKTIEHIENHLGDALCLHDLAQIAGFSDYHFHRVFQTMVGDTVMEYVRKRRLVKAAAEMEHPDRRILDVALDHGFQSHETFTRAFKKLFGITPVEYRRSGIRTPAYPKAYVLSRRFNPYLGGIQLEYRIKNKPAFKLIGYELKTSNEDGQNNKEIPAFWTRYLEQKKYERIPNAVHRDSPVELGVCLDFDPDARTFSYIIGMEAEHFDNVPEDLVCREIPQASYAVFTTPKVKPEDFTASIQSTWMTIFGEWFTNSGYEHSGGPEFEWYDEKCHQQKHELIQMDIYIPVRKKTS